MKNLGYYNGKYDEIENMQIPMLDRVCWFGDGVYDATYAHNHIVFDMDAHLTRFYNSAKLLGMNIPIERDELDKLLRELVKKVDDGDQFVYMQVTRGNGLRGHIYPENMQGNSILFRPVLRQPQPTEQAVRKRFSTEAILLPSAHTPIFPSLRTARLSLISLTIWCFPERQE